MRIKTLLISVVFTNAVVMQVGHTEEKIVGPDMKPKGELGTIQAPELKQHLESRKVEAVKQQSRPTVQKKEAVKVQPTKKIQQIPQHLTLTQAKREGLNDHTYPRKHNTLMTEKGVKILAHDNGDGYKAYKISKLGKKVLQDGRYQIQGGGEITVKGSRIIHSDAAINRRFPNEGYEKIGVAGLG